MKNEMLNILMAVLVFSGGLAVGGGVVAFFTVLGIVSRIIEITDTKSKIRLYEFCMILGAFISCCVYFFDWHVASIKCLSIPLGLVMGIFVGIITAALTETLDLLSNISSKLNLEELIYIIVFVIAIGKIVGSVLYFITL